MSLSSLVLLALTHVLFDFFLQDRQTATNKSKSLRYLIPHLFLIYVGLNLFALFCGDYSKSQAFYFALSNTVLHGIIDWNLIKLYKLSVLKRFPDVTIEFQYWNDSWFYNYIAVDQLLHGLCYLGTYYVITKGIIS